MVVDRDLASDLDPLAGQGSTREAASRDEAEDGSGKLRVGDVARNVEHPAGAVRAVVLRANREAATVGRVDILVPAFVDRLLREEHHHGASNRAVVLTQNPFHLLGTHALTTIRESMGPLSFSFSASRPWYVACTLQRACQAAKRNRKSRAPFRAAAFVLTSSGE